MNQEFKDLLKPPFRLNVHKGYLYIAHHRLGTFYDLSKYPEEFAFFKKWAEQTLNDKWERDFGEPLRWIYEEGYICPKCKEEYLLSEIDENNFNYCPSCGQRLLPPEEKKND